MDVINLKNLLRNSISEKISILEEGENKFRVFSPFYFDDGDRFSIVLKNENGNWILSDEGNTYMHLGLSDLEQKIVFNTILRFDVEDKDGEIIIKIVGGNYGDAFYNFVQVLLGISFCTYIMEISKRIVNNKEERRIKWVIIH